MNRLDLGFANPNIAGLIVVCVLIFLVELAWKYISGNHNWLAALCVVVFLFVSTISDAIASRTAYFTFFLCVFSLCLLRFREKGMLIVSTCMALMYIIIGNKTNQRIEYLNEDFDSLGNRLQLWEGSIPLLIDSSDGLGSWFYQVNNMWYKHLDLGPTYHQPINSPLVIWNVLGFDYFYLYLVMGALILVAYPSIRDTGSIRRFDVLFAIYIAFFVGSQVTFIFMSMIVSVIYVIIFVIMFGICAYGVTICKIRLIKKSIIFAFMFILGIALIPNKSINGLLVKTLPRKVPYYVDTVFDDKKMYLEAKPITEIGSRGWVLITGDVFEKNYRLHKVLATQFVRTGKSVFQTLVREQNSGAIADKEELQYFIANYTEISIVVSGSSFRHVLPLLRESTVETLYVYNGMMRIQDIEALSVWLSSDEKNFLYFYYDDLDKTSFGTPMFLFDFVCSELLEAYPMQFVFRKISNSSFSNAIESPLLGDI